MEDRKKIEMCLEGIICSEADLVAAKNAKLQADENYERRKKSLEKSIKSNYYNIACLKRKAILKQKGLSFSPADHTLCEEESEKEFQRWKKFTPGEKLKEHREKISTCMAEEELADGIYIDDKPLTDLILKRYMEEAFEKELEELEKANKKQ